MTGSSGWGSWVSLAVLGLLFLKIHDCRCVSHQRQKGCVHTAPHDAAIQDLMHLSVVTFFITNDTGVQRVRPDSRRRTTQ
ncbi:hypothetical protein L226DRAFT_533203 [Lentinus tigrinus ALCF2SS1-7]|uniref:uncharacterized protein n=1 Tax=Lentinus tigrinus ALCF2SS1-7 TaxID=1328758 RepID=UPI001166206F|nr:hypothetical protein L226DRAFT_533203 [Lentinus tigrinus ALCF2SS1-7]